MFVFLKLHFLFLSLCLFVCRFEKAALEYQDQLSAATGMDCSLKNSDSCLLKLSNNTSSPKHRNNGK